MINHITDNLFVCIGFLMCILMAPLYFEYFIMFFISLVIFKLILNKNFIYEQFKSIKHKGIIYERPK